MREKDAITIFICSSKTTLRLKPRNNPTRCAAWCRTVRWATAAQRRWRVASRHGRGEEQRPRLRSTRHPWRRTHPSSEAWTFARSVWRRKGRWRQRGKGHWRSLYASLSCRGKLRLLSSSKLHEFEFTNEQWDFSKLKFAFQANCRPGYLWQTQT